MAFITFLVFDVENSMVKPGQEKVRAFKKYIPPSSIHQIRQILELTGYSRHFVKDYAIIAKPLTNLIKKNVVCKWDDKEEKAFGQLQQTLVTRPTLALFNLEAHTEVHTDASALRLAGILLQKQDDQRLHPVAYFTRQTTEPGQKYDSYELETLAMI